MEARHWLTAWAASLSWQSSACCEMEATLAVAGALQSLVHLQVGAETERTYSAKSCPIVYLCTRMSLQVLHIASCWDWFWIPKPVVLSAQIYYVFGKV